MKEYQIQNYYGGFDAHLEERVLGHFNNVYFETELEERMIYIHFTDWTEYGNERNYFLKIMCPTILTKPFSLVK